MRRSRWAAALIAAIAAAGIIVAVPAQATSYRYWTYWSGTETGWTFSSVGPASASPEDGDVEGWRFALSEGLGGQGAKPGQEPAAIFEQVCAGTPEIAGTKRIAVLIDFGTAADAPPEQTPPAVAGHCAQVPPGSTGSQVLQQVADIRSEGGLVCAISGYPSGECAPAVADSPEVASPKLSEDKDEVTKPPKEKKSKSPSTAAQPKPTPTPEPKSARPTTEESSAASSESTSEPTALKDPEKADVAKQRSRQPPKSTSPTPEVTPANPSPSDEAIAAPTEAASSVGSAGPSAWTLGGALLFLGLAVWAGYRYRQRQR